MKEPICIEGANLIGAACVYCTGVALGNCINPRITNTFIN